MEQDGRPVTEKPGDKRREKPRSEKLHPELVRLHQLTAGRRLLRFFARWLGRLVLFLLTHCEVSGLENLPEKDPALIAINHLGDTDGVIAMAYFPLRLAAMGKIELYNFPILGKLMDAYGIIWVHRGQPDRRAIRAALQAFQQGRPVVIAPEGRQSLTGDLEEGTGGAAYLAIKGRVPIVPAVFTGTENAKVFPALKHLRRPRLTLTVGPAFTLESGQNLKEAVDTGTRRIMVELAQLLPKEYRGVYQSVLELERSQEDNREGKHE